MKKNASYTLLLFVLCTFVALSIAAAGPVPADKAPGMFRNSNGKSSYLCGSFKLVHLLDVSIARQEILDYAENLNGQCHLYLKIELVNTDKDKLYKFDFKPVLGSNTSAYYRDTRKLEQNEKDPFWFLEIPEGNYQFTNITADLAMTPKPGYLPFNQKIFSVPVDQFINRTIRFTVKAGQIVCIGDFNCTLSTYFCLYKQTQLYHFINLDIKLNDNLDAAKAAILDRADAKTKEKLDGLEFVSAL